MFQQFENELNSFMTEKVKEVAQDLRSEQEKAEADGGSAGLLEITLVAAPRIIIIV